jgi:predicted RND superfamily exporter protein
VTNLETSEITLESLPQGLVDRMLAPDGTARVQVFAKYDLSDRRAMVAFVESVRPIWQDITGLPVNLVESSYATWDSLIEALAWAFGLVLSLLLLLWRRPRDVVMALIPLVLSVLLTAATSALLSWPLNFVNICVLPLLLGIGVDSGVHMVHRARALGEGEGGLLESTTAQAVFFSAVTTLASFGTLSLSAHQGIASLGSLLVVGMIFSLAGNLIVLPALLSLGGNRPSG